MLNSGQFPSELKLSRVKPLFKNEDPALFTNYRPISLLPLMSKIFECVIFHQLFDYMKGHNFTPRNQTTGKNHQRVTSIFSHTNLITFEQFGFRTGHSTELAAIQLVDHLR